MIKKVAILANGGDVSGFNAVIRAIVKTAENNDIECYGFIDGYNGLLKNNYVKLSTANDQTASGILPKGGSIIGSSTNANVFNYKVEENGQIVYKDLSDVCVENIKKDGFDCIFILGGDGTQKSARDFATKGVNVIGVPKTIDNDVACTEITFGYTRLSKINYLKCFQLLSFYFFDMMTRKFQSRSHIYSAWTGLPHSPMN